MMLCFPKQGKKILFRPPKKAQGYERSRYGYTHRCLSIPATRDLDIQYVDIEQIELFGLQRNPFIENYHIIIVVFSGPHFSIYVISYTLESTQRFNAGARRFK